MEGFIQKCVEEAAFNSFVRQLYSNMAFLLINWPNKFSIHEGNLSFIFVMSRKGDEPNTTCSPRKNMRNQICKEFPISF